MRFQPSLTLLTITFIFLLSDNVLGSPIKGRYMWLKCQPNSKNSNCVEHSGPWFDLPEQKSVKNIPSESSEESSETGESGDGSGDFFTLPNFRRKQRDSGPEELLEKVLNEVEGSSDEVDYPNYIDSGPLKPKLSVEDMLKDNIIE